VQFRIILLFSAIGWGASPVRLPVEVVGAAGTEAGVAVDIPAGQASKVRSLWMEVHGLEYDDMASVRVNQGRWLTLNNQTVIVAEPGKSYGGIGGGFATLKLKLPVAEGVTDGANSVHFRFNHTNGIVSGFRVLAFNFLTADGRPVLPSDTFDRDDPDTWTPPLPDAESVSAGRGLWHSAKLAASGLKDAPGIRAHCADCHANDGRDLKYFNFSNASIVTRSRFHGLSELQGRQIASYIRSLPGPNPGRPWNPPYQPGPSASGAAGAGLSWVLDRDTDTLPFLFPGMAIHAAAFRPDGNLNPREIPIAFQLPDWNHWLPRVHPLDAWGEHFEASSFSQLYETHDGSAAFFDKWSQARARFLPRLNPESKKWTRELAETYYSAQLWQLVKTWEITQETDAAWSNSIPGATAPSEVNIPDTAAGMGGSGLTNEYFSNAWYYLQILLNDGSHRHHGKLPMDWAYVVGHVLDLNQLSGTPEPGRLLVAVIKAMQSTDPNIGPGNLAEGWRPEQNVDPRIMIDEAWTPMFSSLPRDVRTAITESMLRAWLDKTVEYRPASYFVLGLKASDYSQRRSNGNVWDAASQFQAAGVSSELIQRLKAWGKAYTAMAELFHY
jgi:hypothetical protein